jgi:hypothetical protein
LTQPAGSGVKVGLRRISAAGTTRTGYIDNPLLQHEPSHQDFILRGKTLLPVDMSAALVDS